MKIRKHVVPALAATLLAGPAFAQYKAPEFSFNFIGEFDVGFRNVSADDSTQNRTFLANSNSMTSLLIGTVTADFRNGWKGIGLVEIDHDPTSSSKANSSPGGNVFVGTPFQGQQYVGMVSPYGTVKLGIPNSWGLSVPNFSTPYGTGLASGYSGASPLTRLGTTGVSGVNGHNGSLVGRVIRVQRTMTYETPAFSGFSGQLEYGPGNDNAADGSPNNDNEWLAIGGRYQRPGLLVMAWHGRSKAGNVRAAGTTPPAATAVSPNVLPAGQSVTWDMLGGNYAITPNWFGYAGWTKTKTSNDVDNSSSWNLSTKYVWNKMELGVNYLQRSANTGAAAPAANKVPKARLIGVGLDYRLFGDAATPYQAQNAVYLRYEDIDKVDALGRSFRTLSAGIRVGF